LESERVTIQGLKETLKSHGDSAVDRLLEDVGVDKAVHSHFIASNITELQLMSSLVQTHDLKVAEIEGSSNTTSSAGTTAHGRRLGNWEQTRTWKERSQGDSKHGGLL
jgi:hypothetical protein